MDHQKKYSVNYENLAVPEVSTGEEPEQEKPEEPEDTVIYDTLAIPEVHFRKKKESDRS